jgi:hypothetical protein
MNLDALAQGTPYGSQQPPQLSRTTEGPSAMDSDSATKAKDPVYVTGLQSTLEGPMSRDAVADSRSAIGKPSSSARARRRVSRACDQCNQLRTRCDGQPQCARCTGNCSAIFTISSIK